MDVHLAIVDYSMHKKGFSVQRCDVAVRESLAREFGNGLPFAFYAPNWVAPHLAPGGDLTVAAGGHEVGRLITERIKRVSAEHPNSPRVVVASYNFHIRAAATAAGRASGVAVGLIKLAEYANSRFGASAHIEWNELPTQSQPPAKIPLPLSRVADPKAIFPPIELNATVLATAPSNDTAALETATPDPFKRSREMRAPLLKAKIFNEKPTRDLLFGAIKPIVNRGPLQYTKLRRSLAEETFAASGLAERSKWDTQVYFFVRLLLLSGGLLGSDEPLVHGPGTDGQEVVKLKPTFEDDAEAYLVEAVIRELGNVTEFEHCPLAHAVLRCFKSEVQLVDLSDRIAFLISQFADRLSLSETGTYIHQANSRQPALRAVSR